MELSTFGLAFFPALRPAIANYLSIAKILRVCVRARAQARLSYLQKTLTDLSFELSRAIDLSYRLGGGGPAVRPHVPLACREKNKSFPANLQG